MKPLFAFIKKEYLETVRTGKLLILILLFTLFGIMNPAIAKLMPWMMEMLSDTMAESGLIVADVSVNAMTSWTQFFKNIPIALIAFVLFFSDIFTREYRCGTLLLILTKGLSRYKVVLAKTFLLLSLWTAGYGICFAVTYGYNAYYWDNGIAHHLFFSALLWWLFGIWVICQMILFSSLFLNNASVTVGTGTAALLAYLLTVLPKAKAYSPAMLMDVDPLLVGTVSTDAYIKTILITLALSILYIAISIPIMNKKQL